LRWKTVRCCGSGTVLGLMAYIISPGLSFVRDILHDAPVGAFIHFIIRAFWIHFSTPFNFPLLAISFAATACEFCSRCWHQWLLSYTSAWSLCVIDELVSAHVKRWMLHVVTFLECEKSRIVAFKHDTDTPRLSTCEREKFHSELFL
jgi:hypothetical protein